MRKQSKLNKYVELFKRHIAKYLARNISIKTVVHPVSSSGAVFEFFLNQDDDEKVEYSPISQSVGHVLSKIPQRMIGGDVGNVQFGGTSLYLENNRIVVIKGEDSIVEWGGDAVISDVKRVVSSSQGGRD
ncbi:hypothetical protein [Vibrio gigantis]|uniref:hypothetical protein n=1 Tax=Vibrio gigantis TaxID=296199 RepID=UPI001BFE909C|nr:hypothetical protein [Vibrio gigantis]